MTYLRHLWPVLNFHLLTNTWFCRAGGDPVAFPLITATILLYSSICFLGVSQVKTCFRNSDHFHPGPLTPDFVIQVFHSSVGLYCVLSRLRYLQAFKPCLSLSNYGFISARCQTQVWVPSLRHFLLLMIYSDLCSKTWYRSPSSTTSSRLSLITSPERHDAGTCFPYLKNGWVPKSLLTQEWWVMAASWECARLLKRCVLNTVQDIRKIQSV